MSGEFFSLTPNSVEKIVSQNFDFLLLVGTVTTYGRSHNRFLLAFLCNAVAHQPIFY